MKNWFLVAIFTLWCGSASACAIGRMTKLWPLGTAVNGNCVILQTDIFRDQDGCKISVIGKILEHNFKDGDTKILRSDTWEENCAIKNSTKNQEPNENYPLLKAILQKSLQQMVLYSLEVSNIKYFYGLKQTLKSNYEMLAGMEQIVDSTTFQLSDVNVESDTLNAGDEWITVPRVYGFIWKKHSYYFDQFSSFIQYENDSLYMHTIQAWPYVNPASLNSYTTRKGNNIWVAHRNYGSFIDEVGKKTMDKLAVDYIKVAVRNSYIEWPLENFNFHHDGYDFLYYSVKNKRKK